MKICRKFLIIFLISIILLYSIIPSNIVFADEGEGEGNLSSADDAGNIIADFAYDMVANHASETIYDYGSYWPSVGMPENYGRLMAYQGTKVTGYAQGSPSSNYDLKYAEDRFFMDCVGFVSFCIHHSLGITGNSSGNFVVPGAIRSDCFQDVTGQELKPGDIIYSSGHVMIYIGKNGVTFAESSDVNNPSWQIKFRTSYPSSYSVARIKDSAATQIPTSQTKSTWDGQGTSGGGVVTPLVDDSEAFAQYIDEDYNQPIDVHGRNNSESFYYNGTPKDGQYLGEVEDNWLFNTLNDAADWLLGMATMNIKIQLVGWASMFDIYTNKIVDAITNDENPERITVEDIIYNRVPILDVNLFNFETAGGKELNTSERNGDKLIYNLRQKIAEGYVAIRTICIIILLFVLIYLGIRAAIESVAKEEAKYKEKLVAWVVGFMVVMFIHYFMIVVLNINEAAINWISGDSATNTSATVYEQMRSYAYEIPATKGWTGAIVYVFLVYYLIKLLLFYFKRVLIIYILAIVSPAMGIAHAIQRINGKSKALGVWAKDFAFNVIIQFVHALIYTVMMGFIVKMVGTINAIEAVPYVIVLFVILNLLLDAEDIVKRIFKLESSSLKSVLATVFNFKNKFAGALMVGSFIYGQGKSLAVDLYDKNLTKTLDTKYDKYKVQGTDEFSESINKEIERLKEQEKEHTKELTSKSIGYAKKQFEGTVALVAGIPAMFENPISGAAALGYKASNLNSDYNLTGKYGAQAQKLDASTEGTEYIYIDNINEEVIENNDRNGNRQSGNRQSGNRQSENGQSGNRQGGNEQGGNGQSGNGQSGNEQGGNGQSGNGQSGNGQGGNRQGGNGQNGNGQSGNGQNGNGQGRNGQDGNGQQPVIRTYNTKKNKKYTAEKAVLSWATVGRSRAVGNMLAQRNRQEELITTVYRTRIEKLSVIGNIATKHIKDINQELGRMKNSNYPPVYYTPKKDETKAQIAMNEKLREKYREILKKNIIQIYEGVDKDKVSERINDHNEKITLKSIEDIAKEYLSENECNVGEEFKANLDDILRKKLVDTANKNKNGFERITLKPELEEQIREAASKNRKDPEKRDKEIDKVVTEDIKEQVVAKLSVKDLTDLISSTLQKKGSIEMNRDFKKLQEPIENLSMLNKEAKATSGNEVFTTEQILNLIMNKDIME